MTFGLGNIAEANAGKEELIRLVSGALIKEPSFDTNKVVRAASEAASSNEDGTSSSDDGESPRSEAKVQESPLDAMLRLGALISLTDGEFLLKLAVYLRQDLGIRGSANFITSIAAYQRNCQPFLVAYLPRIVQLPSDWLQIASFARDSPLRTQCGLPTSLRKALAKSFAAFNEFSLAKYNTESAQKKRKKQRVEKGELPDDIVMPFTLKQLIRMLHIAEPRYEVMCLLGKAYPSTPQAFRELGLETGQRCFDPARVNRRMRLAVPMTWETQLAAHGNHAHVWEDLVKDRKLPFMAMLRNLRNIILAGCNRATHNEILAKLRSEDQIAASKQFPYRFFSAFDVLSIDPETAYDAPQVKREGAPTKAKPKPATAPTTEQLAGLLEEYRSALQESVRLATKLNIRPIHGKSVLLLHGDTRMLEQVRAQGAKGIGSVRSKLDVALLLAIMLQYACEACDLVLFCEGSGEFHVLPRPDRRVGMLEALKSTLSCVEVHIEQASGGGDAAVHFPYPYLDRVIHSKERIESILLVGDHHCSYAGTNKYPALGSLRQYLERLRHHCNPDLLFVSLAIDGKNSETGIENVFNNANDVLLTGFSDSILRFIAERSGGGPRQYIEHIDEVYHVDTSGVTAAASLGSHDDVDESIKSGSDSDDDDSLSSSSSSGSDDSEPRTTRMLVAPVEMPKTSGYRAMRCFISSTFVDMQCERDALMSDVFPALRAWICRRGWKIHVTPIDFRWGIDSENSKAPTPASVCLGEVSRCSPFVLGLLGDRYGSLNQTTRHHLIPSDPDVDARDFEWLANAPGEGVGLSVTELELRHALHCCSRRQDIDADTESQKGHPRAVVLKRHIVGNLPPHVQSSFVDVAKDAQENTRRLFRLMQASEFVQAKTYAAPVHAASDRSAATTASNALKMAEFVDTALESLKQQVLETWPDLPTMLVVDNEEHDSSSTSDLFVCRRTSMSGSSESSGSSSSFGAPSTIVAPSTRELEGQQDQAFFLNGLLAPYIPPMEAVRAAARFIRGEAATSNDEEDVAPLLSSVLLVHADEGAGKSSFVSYVADHIAASITGPDNERRQKASCISVFFSFQAMNASPVDCLCYVANTLVRQFGLAGEFAIPSSCESSARDALMKLLPELYVLCDKKLRASKLKLLIALDGVDSVAPEAMLSVLPALVPPQAPVRLLFVVGSHSNSPLSIALRARPQPTANVRLPLLSLKERILVVQSHLSSLHKTLQDSVTKGSMVRVLCRKTDAGLPSFLMLSLTFLNLFSKFDTLKHDVRRLPGTLAQLQSDVLRRCETLFTTEACVALFTCLVLTEAIGGSTEEALLATSVNGAETANIARLLAFLKYHRMVAERTLCLLQFTSGALVEAARKRYLSKRAEVHKHHARLLFQLVASAESSHTLRESSCSRGISKALPQAKESQAAADALNIAPTVLQRLSVHSTLALLHHSLESKHWGVALQIGSTIECLVAMIEAGLLPQLLLSMERLKDLHRFTYRKLEPFGAFLMAHRHILVRRPSLAAQTALNMPVASPVHVAAKSAELDKSLSWVEWTNRHVHGERECTMTTQWTTKHVLCAAFSADGSRLAVGGADWVCRVGLILEGTVQHQLKHTCDVTAVAFAGAADSVLITGADDGVIRVWSLHDGSLVQDCKHHGRRINDLTVAGKERNVCLTASDDTTLSLWRVHTGGGGGGTSSTAGRFKPLKTFRHHQAPVSCCAVHQSGQRMVTGSWDGGVAVLATGDQNRDQPPQWLHLDSAIRCVAFVPSMVVTVAVGTFSGSVHLYDAAGEVLSATFHEHMNPISALHISHDAKFMISTDASGRIKLWRQSVTGEVLGSLNGHDTNVPCAYFHPRDSNQCITGSLDATVRHWTFREQGIEQTVGGVHGAAVTAMAVAKGGGFLVTACHGGVAHVFTTDALASSRKWFSINPHSDSSGEDGPVPLCYVAVCNQDTMIALGDIFGTVSVWGASPGLSGRDAPKRFVLQNALVHPIRFVDYHSQPDSWIAISYAGESLRWRVTNMEFATGDPLIQRLDASPVTAASLEAPILAVSCIPEDTEEESGVRTIVIASSVSLLSAVHHGIEGDAHCLSMESMGLEFQELGDEFALPPGSDELKPCTHVAFNDRFMVMAFPDGYLGFTNMADDATSSGYGSDETTGSTSGDGDGLVRLRDDRDPRLWLSICSLAVTPFAPHSSVVCGGTDMTVRLLQMGAAGMLVPCGIFHTTAAPSAFVFTPGAALVCGDTLGNLYTLMVHQVSEVTDTRSAADDTESQMTETPMTGTSSDAWSEYSNTTGSIDGPSIFMELGQPIPVGCRGAARAQWIKRQRDLLRTAAKLQRTVPEARVALRRHAQQAFQAFETFAMLI